MRHYYKTNNSALSSFDEIPNLTEITEEEYNEIVTSAYESRKLLDSFFKGEIGIEDLPGEMQSWAAETKTRRENRISPSKALSIITNGE